MNGAMKWRRLVRGRLVVAAAMLILHSSALARNGGDPADEEVICIGGPRWVKLASDVDRIESTPVPASLLDLYRDPCAFMMRYDVELVEWHLAFGSERSTATALEHVESRLLENRPQPNDYGSALRRAWRAAVPALRRGARIEQSDGAAGYRFLSRRPEFRRLQQLAIARENYVRLAEQHLRAAEEFGSITLLSVAERYLAAYADNSQLVASLGETGLLRHLHFDASAEWIDDLRMRAAVLRFQITRSPDDLARAETLLEEGYDPSFLVAAENAYDGGAEDFCAFGDGRYADLEQACDRDNQFSGRVINYWISRAILDLAGNAGRPRDQLVLDLLEREQMTDSVERYGWRRSKDDIRRILLARVAMHGRNFAGRMESGDPFAASDSWYEGLAALQQLERMASPFDEPRRFRQVATDWLELYGHAATLDSMTEPGFPWHASPAHRRHATYLRTVLEELDGIATGTGGEPR